MPPESHLIWLLVGGNSATHRPRRKSTSFTDSNRFWCASGAKLHISRRSTGTKTSFEGLSWRFHEGRRTAGACGTRVTYTRDVNLEGIRDERRHMQLPKRERGIFGRSCSRCHSFPEAIRCHRRKRRNKIQQRTFLVGLRGTLHRSYMWE